MKKLFVCLFILFFVCGCGTKEETVEEVLEENTQAEEVVETVDIVNLDSNSRVYAVVINNSNAAVKVQEGLDKAIVIYEFPVEGYLTRLLAIYKDSENITIGTIRSARHNFIDYVLEWDAIFVCYGWSHYAKDDMQSLGMDYINGVVNSTAFWRDNPEGLASEHTAYTSIYSINSYVETKGFRTTSESGLVFTYDGGDINLDGKDANTITLNYGGIKIVYEYGDGTYKRIVNDVDNIDHNTKEVYTFKNIIIQNINTSMASDNYYWDLETVGEGTGYYITNGKYVPITWEKTGRDAKTVYKYLDGEEITLSDGNTFVNLFPTNKTVVIE